VFQDKPALFKSFYKWLKPGGKVLISDYCKRAGQPSPEFAQYIKQRGYDLHDVQEYGQASIYHFALYFFLLGLLCQQVCDTCKFYQMLKDAGFDEVIAEDRTDQVPVVTLSVVVDSGLMIIFQD